MKLHSKIKDKNSLHWQTHKMIPMEHQIEGADWALQTVRDYGFAYLSWQERTRKTLTALLAVENSKAKTCLVVTKKQAMDGWIETLAAWKHETKFVVINYESIHKIKGNFDFIILDESHHAISSTGRPSATWKKVMMFTFKKPIIYLSATPYAEHLGLIYHQLKLSHWTPFKQRNFYDFFRLYGISCMTRTPYGLKETYSKYKDEEILEILKPYFDFKTRKEVGIEHEPSVNVITIPLLDTTKSCIEELMKKELLVVGGDNILADSPMKLRMMHYQIEGGTLKIRDKKSIHLRYGQEKVAYIKENYDQSKIAIMAHFIEERSLLSKAFPKALILSSDGHAEGVDLHTTDKLLVYSMSFKTSKYTQRLARQANHDRATPIVVDILVANKPGIGFEVYKAVAIKKQNFDKNSYERIW